MNYDLILNTRLIFAHIRCFILNDINKNFAIPLNMLYIQSNDMHTWNTGL